MDGLDAAKIGIASSTYEVVGMPELRVRVMPETPAVVGRDGLKK
jgi:hypothetical protein